MNLGPEEIGERLARAFVRNVDHADARLELQQLGREMAEVADRLRREGRPFSTLDLYRQDSVSRVLTELSQTIEAVAA